MHADGKVRKGKDRLRCPTDVREPGGIPWAETREYLGSGILEFLSLPLDEKKLADSISLRRTRLSAVKRMSAMLGKD
jgi:hypothetical protein